MYGRQKEGEWYRPFSLIHNLLVKMKYPILETSLWLKILKNHDPRQTKYHTKKLNVKSTI